LTRFKSAVRSRLRGLKSQVAATLLLIYYYTGGYGGDGGKGETGGAGGLGEAPSVALEDVKVFGNFKGKQRHQPHGLLPAHLFIQGGKGGNGGEGKNKGPDGIGQEIKFGKPLISFDGKAGRVPVVTVDQFCRTYHLSNTIRKSLVQEGYETVGALLWEYDTDMKNIGFKSDEIAEIRRALEEFVDGFS
jgi:hypothetical protein